MDSGIDFTYHVGIIHSGTNFWFQGQKLLFERKVFEGANSKNVKLPNLPIEIVGNTEIKIDNMHFLLYCRSIIPLLIKILVPEQEDHFIVCYVTILGKYFTFSFTKENNHQLFFFCFRKIEHSSYEFHKHLCEVHFRERLLASIPQSNPKEGEDASNPMARKFKCPIANCQYELPQR